MKKARKRKTSDRVSPAEARSILQELATRGITIEKISEALGVTTLYATRLEKESYWRDGYIPVKTGAFLRELLRRHSPESTAQACVDYMTSLQKGDLYCIHSARDIFEFKAKLVRKGILECAHRGVRILYMFPNTSNILSSFSSAPLELASFIPLDLRNRYELLMETFKIEAKESNICSLEEVLNNIEVREVTSPFLFSPWTKIVFCQYHRNSHISTKLVQEHFDVGQIPSQTASSVDWYCEGNQATSISSAILASPSKVLPWN